MGVKTYGQTLEIQYLSILHSGQMASVRPNATRGSFQSIVAMVFGTAKLTDFKDLSLSLTKQINADLRSANEVPEGQ